MQDWRWWPYSTELTAVSKWPGPQEFQGHNSILMPAGTPGVNFPVYQNQGEQASQRQPAA